MFRKIKEWFRSLVLFGQFLQDEKVITKGLLELKESNIITGYKLDVYTDLKNDNDDFKKEVSIYVGSKTNTFVGYSSVKLLADIRNSLES